MRQRAICFLVFIVTMTVMMGRPLGNDGAVSQRVIYHDQSFPAQSYLTAAPKESDGLRIERVGAVALDESNSRLGPAIEIVTPGNLKTNRADTVDGVVFSVSANKAYFKTGDSLRVWYRIRNRTMGTVLYDFNTGCQFDVQVRGSRGARLYSHLEKQTCSSRPSRISLKPSTETVMEFPPLPLSMRSDDTLRVTAQMAGYPLSAVPLSIVYKSGAESSSLIYLGSSATDKPVVDFNHDTKMLVIRLSRAERLTISAFVLTGKKVNKLSTNKFLAPGTHLISFRNRKLVDGVVIFKIEGNGFSESKTINLTR